jgi:hypothetical protein
MHSWDEGMNHDMGEGQVRSGQDRLIILPAAPTKYTMQWEKNIFYGPTAPVPALLCFSCVVLLVGAGRRKFEVGHFLLFN